MLDPVQQLDPTASELDKVCHSTPFSQASTAPATPAGLVPLPDPKHFARLCSWDSTAASADGRPFEQDSISETAESEISVDSFVRAMDEEDGDDIDIEAVACIGLPPLQSDLARWAQAEVEREEKMQTSQTKLAALEEIYSENWEDESSDAESEDSFVRGMHEPDLDLDLGEIRAEPVALSLGMPPLQSELAKWAREEVLKEMAVFRASFDGEEEEEEEDDFVRAMQEPELDQEPAVLTVGMPALQSELGRWAQAQVEQEEQASKSSKVTLPPCTPVRAIWRSIARLFGR